MSGFNTGSTCILNKIKITDYNETNLRIRAALDCQRTFLNKWRDALYKKKADVDKERIRLEGIVNFIRTTQSLQDKLQNRIDLTMNEAQRCLQLAVSMEGTVKKLSRNNFAADNSNVENNQNLSNSYGPMANNSGTSSNLNSSNVFPVNDHNVSTFKKTVVQPFLPGLQDAGPSNVLMVKSMHHGKKYKKPNCKGQ